MKTLQELEHAVVEAACELKAATKDRAHPDLWPPAARAFGQAVDDYERRLKGEDVR